jgi:prepilin-type N-terminal cleavage/methylation domain-containing protein
MIRRAQHGFTIIEVLIVLAIAGVILVIVFLAIPSVQRGQRNTQRKADARYIASQRQQYNLDNKTVISAGEFDCSLPHDSKLFCKYVTTGLGLYKIENVTFSSSGSTPPSSVPTITDSEKILTDTYLKCAANGRDAVIAPSARYSVVLYAVETGGSGVKQQCLESSLFPS